MAKLIRVVDVETTGLDPAVDRICEVGTVDLMVGDDGEITRGQMWSSLINPGIPIPDEASGVHDITDEMVTDAPAFSDVVSHVMRDVPDAYCAHNSRFDSKFLKFSDNVPWIDTYRVALFFYPEAGSHSNNALRYFFKLKLADNSPNRHRALGDAYITAAILRRFFVIGIEFNKMLEISLHPAVLPRLRFGEHAMKPISTVPVSYLEWMIKCDGRNGKAPMDEDARHTAFVELNRRREPA